MRNYKIIIGSKTYFDQQVKNNEKRELKFFLDLIRLSDNSRNTKVPFQDKDKADVLVIKNDSYLGIVESANDRLGALINEISTDNSTIWLHNPPFGLINFIESQKEQNQAIVDEQIEKYQFVRTELNYNNAICAIRKHIIGQDFAVTEISKSLYYLTQVSRNKPYVIMLYGSSSIGKTELVREIAKNFFENKFFEKHLSMFNSQSYFDYFFGDKPNRKTLGYELLERESNLIFLDEIDKCLSTFYSGFYTLFDNKIYKDSVYDVDMSGSLIILTSNYANEEEMKEKLGLPIFYRIAKFIHFEDFSTETIKNIVDKEINDKYDEYKACVTKEDIYNIVSKLVSVTGENARTIKNKVQLVIEDLLFKQLISKKEKN